MVSGIAIKFTNRISSCSLLQNYKMHNTVSCRTVKHMNRLILILHCRTIKFTNIVSCGNIQCINLIFILHCRTMKCRITVRRCSSLQNYTMNEYGKLHNYKAYEQSKMLFFAATSSFPMRVFFFTYETRIVYDIFVFPIYVTCPNTSSYLDYLSQYWHIN